MQLTDSEIERLLDTVRHEYGYDFTGYSRASQKRRIARFMTRYHTETIDETVAMLARNDDLLQALIFDLTVVVTEMFRDPWVYQTIREKVIPWLKTFPFIRIWHAGCATGEEVYAMAILLQEEGLADRSLIYATDLNDEALQKAKEGIYPLARIQEYTRNYQEAGGRSSFSDYYHARYDAAKMDQELSKNISFANHNLVTDTVFGEMQLVMCRNVLIYFDRPLQNRVLQLFHDSLCSGGLLCLGTKESIRFTTINDHFETVAREEKIYKKKAEIDALQQDGGRP